MGTDLKNGTYDVGFGRPPKHARFKPGQSGNSRGRPRGTLNIETALERTSQEKVVVVSEDGRNRTVTKLEAAVKQLMNRAASGELKAFQIYAGLRRTAEARTQMPAPDSALDEVDQKVVLGILKRLETAERGGHENVDEPEAE
jgi:hypothetical protein